MNCGESLLTGLLETVRRVIVTELMRGRLQYFKRAPGFQVVLGLRECVQFLIGGHHRLIVGQRAFFALQIGPDRRKEAGAVEVQIGGEMFLIESIHERGPILGNVAMAKALSDHRPILLFPQGVVVGLTGTGCGEGDQELAEKASHPPIDVCRHCRSGSPEW